MGTPRDWYTVQQVAADLQVNEETVGRWIRRRDLPAVALGGTKAGYRIARADLEAFVQQRYGMTLGEAVAAA